MNAANKKTAARQVARAKRSPPIVAVAFKARCSFKMVISRPHEHLARGQFNSGRMIAPSRSYCPFIFLRLPLSIQSATPSDLVRTRYTPRARLCDFHPLASFSKGRSLVRAFAKGRLFRPSFCTFSPLAPQWLFLSPQIISMEIASR